MKKTSLLLTALLSVSSTAFAQTDLTLETIELPKYTVTAPRHTDSEKEISKNLNALRAQANVEAFTSELPVAQAASHHATMMRIHRNAKPQRVAKS